jgi:hypothetical protein
MERSKICTLKSQIESDFIRHSKSGPVMNERTRLDEFSAGFIAGGVHVLKHLKGQVLDHYDWRELCTPEPKR